MSNHMIKNVSEILFGNLYIEGETQEFYLEIAKTVIQALKENDPNSFIAEIINKYAGLNPMDEHGRKLWNNLVDAVLNMKEKT